MTSFESRTQQIGREIFARARRAEPSVLRLGWWQRRMLDWVMKDEPLKVQLFRFIEALPRLRGSEAVASHLKQYLRGGRSNGSVLPLPFRLATDYESHTSLHARLSAFAARFGSLQMAGTFIAGSTAEEAIATVLRMRRDDMTFTLDVLGETILCSGDADHFQQVYLDLIEAMSAAAPSWPANPLLDEAPFGSLPRVNLSIKLSALTGKFDPIANEKAATTVIDRLAPVLQRARQCGVFINVDLEHYAVKELTFDIFKRVMSMPEFRDWSDVGVVVQAYLRDSEEDLWRLIEWVRGRGAPITVRLVKGAYWDYETTLAIARGWPIPVWTEKWQSDANYEKLGRILLENASLTRPAFASHNVRSLAAVLAMSEELRLPARTLEVQMLYGMGDPLKTALIDLGRRLRVYTPFGDLMPGMAYFIRRLLENTANEGFLRQSFSDNVPEHVLLAAPAARPDAPRTPLPGFRRDGPDEDHDMQDFRNEPETNFADRAARERMAAAIRDVMHRDDRNHAAWIGGRPVATSEWHNLRNPSRPGENTGRVALCGEQHVSEAVAAAASAFPWQTSAERRGRWLGAAAQIIRDRRMEFTALIVAQLGKTWREADTDMASTIDAFEFYGREMARLASCPRVRDIPGETNEHVFAPRGVVAMITSWQGGLSGAMQTLAAALAAGNTVVWLPDLPVAGLASEMAGLLARAGLPDGALNVIAGADQLAERLAAQPEVAVVAIAHRRDVVRRVAVAAAQTTLDAVPIKRQVIATTGESVVIVDDDTDIDEAVLGTLASSFGFAGQGYAGARVIVVDGATKPFTERLIAAAREVAVGPADDPATTIGPLIDAATLARAQIAAASARNGSRVLMQRDHSSLIEKAGGYYFGPLIVADVPGAGLLSGAEACAPILAVIAVADLDAALKRVNASAHAMTCVFYSRSPDNIARARREAQSGVLFINRRAGAGVVDRQPVGGLGLAGSGRPPGGPEYLREFLDVRTITENVMRHGLAPVESAEPTATAALSY